MKHRRILVIHLHVGLTLTVGMEYVRASMNIREILTSVANQSVSQIRIVLWIRFALVTNV